LRGCLDRRSGFDLFFGTGCILGLLPCLFCERFLGPLLASVFLLFLELLLVDTGALKCGDLALRHQMRRFRVEDWRSILHKAYDVDAFLRREGNGLNGVARRVGIDEVTAVVVRHTDLQCVRALDTGDEDALSRSLETRSAL
jgi:hypothetical protein